MKIVRLFLERMWRGSAEGFAAALFRIVLGVLGLWTAIGVFANRERYFSEHGVIPWRIVSDFPWSSWSLLALAPTSDRWLSLVCGALVVASAGYLVGLAPRLCSALVFLIHVSLHHRNPYIFNSGDRLFLMLSGLGMFLPLGRVYSLSAYWRAQRGLALPASAGVWSQRLIQLQICHVYWFSCFAKLRYPGWRQGTAMRDVLASPVFSEWPIDAVPWVFSAVLTWGTLLFEFGFPLGVFQPRLRRWALLAGVLFHLGIDLTMKIPMFSAVMLASYVLFLKEDEARAVLKRLLGTRFEATAASPATS
jgi:hypothetical protein